MQGRANQSKEDIRTKMNKKRDTNIQRSSLKLY